MREGVSSHNFSFKNKQTDYHLFSLLFDLWSNAVCVEYPPNKRKSCPPTRVLPMWFYIHRDPMGSRQMARHGHRQMPTSYLSHLCQDKAHEVGKQTSSGGKKKKHIKEMLQIQTAAFKINIIMKKYSFSWCCLANSFLYEACHRAESLPTTSETLPISLQSVHPSYKEEIIRSHVNK